MPAHPDSWMIRSAVAVVLAVLAACSKPANDAASAPVPTVQRVGQQVSIPEGSALRDFVVVQAVEQRVLSSPLSVPAVVEADPAHVANILPPLAGRISGLFVRLGDPVKPGQPLFTIDSADLAQARSDLQHAEHALSLTQKALARTQDLAAHGIAAEKDLEQAQSDHAGAESDYERAAAVFRLLGLSPDAKTSPRQLTVTAPITGRVAALNAVAGTYINDSTAALMTVADIGTVWIAAGVQEKDLAAVTVGEEVSAVLQSYPGEAFTGKVAFIADQLDPDTRTVKVRIAYQNRDARLKPGMFATASFAGRPHEALLVPTTALIQNENHTRVYVETAPWTFEAREVITGAREGDSTEILRGLEAGQRIVAKQGVLLGD